MKYWLVYYEQRHPNMSEFIGTNSAIDGHPADFLHHLCTKYPEYTNRLTYSIEISKKQFSALKESL
jgi:hypothetical protein